jgi:hypothetical protein
VLQKFNSGKSQRCWLKVNDGQQSKSTIKVNGQRWSTASVKVNSKAAWQVTWPRADVVLLEVDTWHWYRVRHVWRVKKA